MPRFVRLTQGVRVDLGVLERSPEAGDVEAVDGLVGGYVARAERFGVRASSVRAAGDGLVAASAGDWASALGERSVRLAAGLDDAAGGCRQVAAVLAEYGAALRGVQRRVRVARHEVASARVRAVAARERYSAAVAAGGGAGVPWSWTDAPAFPSVAGAAAELAAWRDAVEDAVAGVRAFEACCEEREVLDRSTAARLAGVEAMAAYAPGTGVDAVVDVPLVQALAAAGAGAVSAAQGRVMAEWFVGAAAAVADDPKDAAALRALSEFLDAWGSETGVMATVFATLGGDRTLRVVTALGNAVRFGDHEENGTLGGVAQEFRSALASASLGWSHEEAAVFADGMFGPVLFADGTASVIGYLFADGAREPMGAEFTVAVADRLDAWERERGRLPQGVHQPGYWLAAAAAPGSDPRGVLDPATGVMATLGGHPEKARDWLTGAGPDWISPIGTFDRARIAYWFGERDWSAGASDGFAGIGALWVGVQASTADPAAQRQVAAINEAVFGSLFANAGFLLTENISGLGSERLAQAVSLQFVGLVEVGAMRDPVPAAGSWESVQTPLASADVVTASVRQDWLAVVLAAATSEAEGREVVHRSLLEYESQILIAASDGSASVDQVMERLATVWGVADGAITGATDAELHRASERVREGLGLARAPVDSALALVPNPIVAIGLDAAADHLEKLAVESLTPGPAAELVRASSGAPLSDYFTDAIGLYQRTGLWDQPPVRSDSESVTDAAAYAQRYVTTYMNTAEAMRVTVAGVASMPDVAAAGTGD